jgi:mxaJ protein
MSPLALLLIGALRVCADPNNLPFSNEREEGFENAIAQVIAKDLGHREVEYFWWAQRRGFIRNTLQAERCDVVIGLPIGFEMALMTKPYYRSTYVFVSRDRTITSLDDIALRSLKIGVPVIGDDYTNPPPVHALGRRGIVENVVGFTVYGDYASADPPLGVLDALAVGQVDVAIVWGPLAGFYAKRSKKPLVITPITPEADGRELPFTFEIGMGVRKRDRALRDRLERIIERRRPQIDRILESFGVPR